MEEGKVDKSEVKAYYDDPGVVEHYRRATANVGLWKSEEIVFNRVFGQMDRILELGTGTGRIAIGLAELGFPHVMGIELAGEMVKEARRIARVLELSVYFRRGDATQLEFEDHLFDGAIFGFNGLMQIPGRDSRRRALTEIFRVIRPGGALVFTTHDRQNPRHKKFWREERRRWEKEKQKPELLEFGDRWEKTEYGMLFIHVPECSEIREDLKATGWKAEWDSLRSSIARETPETLQFSDDCRFWVVRKPS
ncbi:MAG: class I SAM-dependent methyltransferase [Opitutales bacterium]|jgi:ubiquinone/menaquinone biosynthesis C-methylase UbiE